MELSALLLALPLFLSLLILFRNKKYKSRNLPPSPPYCLPIIGHLHLLKEPVRLTFNALSRRYGDLLLLRLGTRPVLLVSSPSVVEECFITNDVALSDRPRMIAGEVFHYDCSTVAALPYGPLWRNQRRIITEQLFSPSRMASLCAVRQQEVNVWVDRIRQRCALSTAKIDLQPMFVDLPFNSMTMMILGKRYFGEDVADVEDAQMFREAMQPATELSGNTNIGDFLLVFLINYLLLIKKTNIGDFIPLFKWIDVLGTRRKMVKVMEKMDGFMQNLVDEHRLDLSSHKEMKSKNLVHKLLEMQQTDPDLYTDDMIKGMIIVLIGAGTDTSAIAADWAMALLINHPDAMEKVRDEIDANVGRDRMLEEQDLPKLSYLQNVIQEALRLYPPVPLLVPRQTSKECTLGYNVPAGTMVVVNAWAIQRDPRVWEDPERFWPERFEVWNGEGHMLVPFGAGRRGCAGISIANKVVGMALGSLVQAFEWERVGGEEVNMTEGLGLTLFRVKPLEVMCTLRK